MYYMCDCDCACKLLRVYSLVSIMVFLWGSLQCLPMKLLILLHFPQIFSLNVNICVNSRNFCFFTVRSFPYRRSDIEWQHHVCLFLHQGWADKHMVISGKSFSSKATAEPKVASPPVYYGQFIYIIGSCRFIGYGKILSLGCYCYWSHPKLLKKFFPKQTIVS